MWFVHGELDEADDDPVRFLTYVLTALQRVLVLDDYHVLADPGIHESVDFLLAYLPPALPVVMAGRSDPRCRWPAYGRAAS